AEGRGELLRRAIFASDRLLALAERPLLLTLMASLHALHGGDLPAPRGQPHQGGGEAFPPPPGTARARPEPPRPPRPPPPTARAPCPAGSRSLSMAGIAAAAPQDSVTRAIVARLARDRGASLCHSDLPGALARPGTLAGFDAVVYRPSLLPREGGPDLAEA